MKLTQREKYIAMAVGVTILLVVLYEVVLSPYFDALSDVEKQTDAAVVQQKANTALFEKQKKLNADWLAITHELKADDSAAEIQAVNKALDWAQAAGVNIAAYKAERSTMAGDFEVIGFHLTGTGSTPAMARLLYSFETAPIPVRVDQMTLTPVKEGTDNLKIELDLSTLCSKPPADTPAKSTLTASGRISQVQPWTE